MFELSDFYSYCKENKITVLPFDNAPSKGITMRDRGLYAIFLDFTQIRSTQLLRGVCYHELGHVATGALHGVESPFETVERSEYRAKPLVCRDVSDSGGFQRGLCKRLHRALGACRILRPPGA